MIQDPGAPPGDLEVGAGHTDYDGGEDGKGPTRGQRVESSLRTVLAEEKLFIPLPSWAYGAGRH